MIKKKEMIKFLEKYDDEDVIECTMWSDYSEEYTKPVDVEFCMRLPKRTEFKHKECKHYEQIKIKDKLRGYCNRKEDFIREYVGYNSCDDFVHNTREIDYCLECEYCDWNYGNCEGLIKRS